MTVLLLLAALAVRADVLMLDLNNADGENNACAAADPGKVFVVNQKSMNVKKVDADVVEDAITRMEAAGKSIDTIVISGHDGNGEYFGGDKEENGFNAAQLDDIISRHPKTRAALKNLALWGCYGGTVNAAENYWLNPGRGAVFTIAFPLQSPNKYNKPSQKLLGEFCAPEKRAAAASAASKDALCDFYRKMPMLRTLNASVANCNSIATSLYGREECFGYDELKARCGSFDPSREQLNLFRNYMLGSPGYENPPLDGDDVFADPGKTPLRKFYDQLHLWRHCYDSLKKDLGYEMPSGSQVIRLVKFKQLKDNLNRLNRAELNDFDARLEQLGLGHLALGDLSNLTRAEINQRVNEAVRRLHVMASQGVTSGTTQSGTVLTMARGIKATLVDLNYKVVDRNKNPYRCSHFSLVHAGATDAAKKSQCIMSYVQAERSL